MEEHQHRPSSDTSRLRSSRVSSLKPSVETIETRGIKCVVHCWKPPPPFFRFNQLAPAASSTPRGVVVVYHGLGGHARFPTVRYLAEMLSSKANFIVYGMDFPGHGLSPGMRGYISSADDLVKDGLTVAQHAQQKHPELPLFLAGSSLGGAISLSVSLLFREGEVAGLVLLAPMIKVAVPRWQRNLVKTLNKFMPQSPLIPCSEDSGVSQFRDPVRRDEVNADTLSYSGNLRVASAHSCVDLYTQVRKNLSGVNCPFICLLANEDVVVDNSGAQELLTLAKTIDRTVKRYDALHGLLCEPQSLRVEIEGDIMEWMIERSCQKKSESLGVAAKKKPLRDAFLTDLENALMM